MNQLQTIKNQLNEINNSRIKIQTLIDQAQKQCNEIQQKYGVSSIEELRQLVEKAEGEYQNQLTVAQQYIKDTNEALSKFNGII